MTSDKHYPDEHYKVLFLCTGNSARSIMAECILNRAGEGRFSGYSAGSHPGGRVHPHALSLLRSLNHPTDGLRSKSWDEFAAEGVPKMDFVFTVCDNAAGEICPIWPGTPMTAHWPFPDPAAFDGAESEHRTLFAEIYGMLERRISIFVDLPITTLDGLSLKKSLDEIGEPGTEPAKIR
jgi:arsenate reductase (thioredoxin)